MNKPDVIRTIVNEIIRKYWIGYPSYILDNYIQRHVFEVGLLNRALAGISGKTVVDVGGVHSLHPVLH